MHPCRGYDNIRNIDRQGRRDVVYSPFPVVPAGISRKVFPCAQLKIDIVTRSLAPNNFSQEKAVHSPCGPGQKFIGSLPSRRGKRAQPLKQILKQAVTVDMIYILYKVPAPVKCPIAIVFGNRRRYCSLQHIPPLRPKWGVSSKQFCFHPWLSCR